MTKLEHQTVSEKQTIMAGIFSVYYVACGKNLTSSPRSIRSLNSGSSASTEPLEAGASVAKLTG